MSDSEKNITPGPMNRGEVYYRLRSRLYRDQEDLLGRVDLLRPTARLDSIVGIGLITLSSICIRDCIYCGYRASLGAEERFRLSRSEIMQGAETALESGVRSLILKSGDDPGLSEDTVAELVRDLVHMGFEISLSLGEREDKAFQRWKRSGASSYWLRHETCDPHLYRRIRPSMFWVDRVKNISAVKAAGLKVSTGILIGMPNQSYESLLEDLLKFEDPDIIALAFEPYLPPPDSKGWVLMQKPENMIVVPDLSTMQKIIAVARILRPDVLITAGGSHVRQYDALSDKSLWRAGANALILDFTPEHLVAFESKTPFTGHPVRDRSEVEKIGESLAAMGLELVFTNAPAA